MKYTVDEAGSFQIHITSDHLSIRIGQEKRITEVWEAERTLLGVNDKDMLVAVQLTRLQPDEAAKIRNTFPTIKSDR